MVDEQYTLQPIQAVDKLEALFMAAIYENGLSLERGKNNSILRIGVEELTKTVMKVYGNGGFFYEYKCMDINELHPILNDRRCQTVSVFGNKEKLRPILMSGIRGVDRVTDIGRTMNFDLLWDGYNLISQMTREISIT